MRPEFEGDAGDSVKLEEVVGKIVEEAREYATSSLRLGRARVLRSKKGLLHVAYNAESCLCGWVWAHQEADVLFRSGPVAGETNGWCSRCHRWALEIADGD